jgi:aspartyl-tRNA(Asn)/glutamyl-tRNA(Gln) amidotransferase subunit A
MVELDAPYATIDELSLALHRRQFSSVELVRSQLDRIAALDPALHAFAEVDAPRALEAAAFADAQRKAGDEHPLLGVPLAIKDAFDHAGARSRAGSLVLADRCPSRSATAVARLERAGMVVIGRTHMVEFGFGGWGTNTVRGTPRNPHNRDIHYVPGGSSSGSAVAVAAGLSPAALGTDTGGSIRTPAAFCGVVGLKTSQGLIGRGGVVPLSPSFDTVGPLARSVVDIALLFGAMTGPDERDPATANAPFSPGLGDLEGGVGGLRLGHLGGDDLDGTNPDIRRHHDDALADLRRLGAQLHEISLPLSIPDYLSQGGDIMSAESAPLLGPFVDRPNSPVDPIVRERILRGRDIGAERYNELLNERRAAQAALIDTFRSIDAFVMPGSHTLPVALSAVEEAQPPNRFGRLVNYLDLASLALPVGRSANGLPCGLQIVVPKFADALALRIGRALERHRQGLFMPPAGY